MALPLFGCNEEFRYHPGGPYYYTSDIANYQLFRPNGEITKDRAAQLSKEGYAYYIAFFNNDGQPTLIEKRYQGKIDRKSELFYKNEKLLKSVITNSEGIEAVAYHISNRPKTCDFQFPLNLQL